MPREAISFAGTYLDVTSHMQTPPPSEVIEELVKIANRNPSGYVGIAPSGTIFTTFAEVPVKDENDELSDKMVWLPWEAGDLTVSGVINKPDDSEWIIGPDGIRGGIWPTTLHDLLRKAYETYSLFGIGDEHDPFA